MVTLTAAGAPPERARADRRGHWLAALLLLGSLAGMHYDVLFLGRSVVHSNYFNPFDFRSLPANYGPDRLSPREWTGRNLSTYANLRDPGATWWQWEPSTAFLLEAIRTAEWPLWDPYIAAGTPAMANLVPAFFFPPYTAVVALGASIALRNAYFLALLWGASFFTYLLLQRHGLTWTASLAGGGLVLLSGGLNQNLGSFMGQTACCLPFLAYATRLFLDRPTPRAMVGLAGAYGCVALASFPPLLIAMFGIVAFYALVASITEHHDHRARLRSLVMWGAAAALGVGLVGFYFGPVMALRHDAPQVALLYRDAAVETTIPLRNVLQLLSPTVLGGVQVYLNGPFAEQNGSYISYMGAAAVLCALLARSDGTPRMRTLWISSTMAAVAIVLKLVGLPPVQWTAHLPLLNQIHTGWYFGVPLGFLVAVLAALGIDGLQRSRVPPAHTIVAGVAVLVSVLLMLRLAYGTGLFSTAVSSYVMRDWKFLAAVAALASLAAVGSALGREGRARRLGVAALLLVAGAEGIYNNWYPKPRRWDIFEQPVPYMELLRNEAGRGRVFSFGAPDANINEGFEVFGIDSLMAFNPPRIFDVYRRYAGAPVQAFMRGATRIPPDAVLDRANVAFIGARKTVPGIAQTAAARQYRTRFDDGFAVIYERPTTPRFFFSSEYRVMPQAQALEAIAAGPAREIVLEVPPGIPLAPNQSPDPEVRVDSYRRNSVVLTVEAPRPGLVYAAESFFPGWSARVNGAETSILPANYAFRAVPVAAGQSRIEFRYWPSGLTAGLLVSCASIVVACLLMLKGASDLRSGA